EVHCKPWEWPCIVHPDDTCPYPPGAGAATSWPHAQALYRVLNEMRLTPANAKYAKEIVALKELQALGLKERSRFYVSQPHDGRGFVKVDAGLDQSAQVGPMLRRPLVQALERGGAHHDADNGHSEVPLREPVQNSR